MKGNITLLNNQMELFMSYPQQPTSFAAETNMEKFIYKDIFDRSIAGGADAESARYYAEEGLSIYKTHRFSGPFYKVADKLIAKAKKF